MSKDRQVKAIDLPNPGDSPISASFTISDNVDRVDGFHAFSSPRPGALLALGPDGKFPASALPAMGTEQFTGHHGVQFFGPTCYNAEDILPTDESIIVTAPMFSQEDTALASRWDGYEYMRIAGPGEIFGAGWKYPVERGLLSTAKQAFDAYSEIVNLGPPGTGGHIVVDSASSAKSPTVKWRSNEADRTFRFHGLFGKLADVPAGFRSRFPTFTDWDTSWGFATENGFLSGGLHALYGDIAGSLSVSGTLTVQGPSESSTVIGQTISGWGIVLRASGGRPVIQALAPFVDSTGTVVSDVAFVIDNNGKPGLSYMQIPGTDQHRLEIGVDTLIGGSLRVGETIMVGTGAWGADFAGVAIDSEWGFVGLGPDDTFDSTPSNGTYEVWWDKATGKLYTGGGAIGFGKQGMSLRARKGSEDTPEGDPATIKWYEDGNKTMQIGSYGMGNGYWVIVQEATGSRSGYESVQGIRLNSVSGMQIVNLSPGTDTSYFAPASGSHKFYVGDQLLFQAGQGFALQLPMTLIGSEITSYWTESGRLGMGTESPDASLHIDGRNEVPQLQLSRGPDIYTRFWVADSGTMWTTTGDIILGPSTNAIKPYMPYGVNLGTPFNKFLSIHAAELVVETLVAQQKIATIGGRIVVTPTTQLTVDVQTGDTVIYVKHNSIVSGDRLLLEADGQLEAMGVTSSATTTPTNGYRYTVTRNLDGTGANKWAAGAAVVNTGQTGAGWIDLYSGSGLAKASTYGPTIVGNVRLSNTWNDWRERWGIGNLNGLYGYSATTWGVGFGNPLATHILIDDANGYRLRNNTTTVAQWNATGDLTLGATGAVSITAAGSATFTGKVVVGTGNNIIILDPANDTYRAWAGHAVAASAPWSVKQTGFMTATSGVVGGWTLGSTQFTGGNATLSSTGILTLGTGNNVIVLSAADATYRAWAGNALPASSPWSLTQAGFMTATSGRIAGFTLSGNTFTSGNLVLDAANQQIQFGSVTMKYVSTYLSVLGTLNVSQRVVANECAAPLISASTNFRAVGLDGITSYFTLADGRQVHITGGIITSIA